LDVANRTCLTVLELGEQLGLVQRLDLLLPRLSVRPPCFLQLIDVPSEVLDLAAEVVDGTIALLVNISLEGLVIGESPP
jgi:hypothetical protein